jgi:hypothetical protein
VDTENHSTSRARFILITGNIKKDMESGRCLMEERRGERI